MSCITNYFKKLTMEFNRSTQAPRQICRRHALSQIIELQEAVALVKVLDLLIQKAETRYTISTTGFVRNLTNPCGGGLQYLHRCPASSKRRQEGNTAPGAVPGGYECGDLAFQVGEVSDETVKYGREFCGTSTQH
jgi:hypothetical protein